MHRLSSPSTEQKSRRASLSTRHLGLVAGIFLLISASCGGGGSGDDDSPAPGNGGGSQVFAIEAVSDGSGRATAAFTVPLGTNKFGITAESGGNALRFESLSNDLGAQYVNPGGATTTLADEVALNVSYINVPSRSLDTQVDPTLVHTTTLILGDSADGLSLSPQAGRSVVLTFNTSNDPDFENGTLTVNFFLVGDLAQGAEGRASINQAIAEMQRIYANVGIAIRVNLIDLAGPSVLPDPIDGDDFYLSGSSTGASPGINVFIGTDVGSPFGSSGVLGISSSIPGTPNPSARSAVSVSLLVGAGPDGVFSSQELRVLGETLAHECGHYIGLFHPVNISGGGVVLPFDPLSDTDECFSPAECFSNRELIGNLMFFTPILEENGDFVPQDSLTSEQRGVMNRYSATN